MAEEIFKEVRIYKKQENNEFIGLFYEEADGLYPFFCKKFPLGPKVNYSGFNSVSWGNKAKGYYMVVHFANEALAREAAISLKEKFGPLCIVLTNGPKKHKEDLKYEVIEK